MGESSCRHAERREVDAEADCQSQAWIKAGEHTCSGDGITCFWQSATRLHGAAAIVGIQGLLLHHG